MSSEAHEPRCTRIEPKENLDLLNSEDWLCGTCDELFSMLNDREPISCPYCGIHNTVVVVNGELRQPRN